MLTEDLSSDTLRSFRGQEYRFEWAVSGELRISNSGGIEKRRCRGVGNENVGYWASSTDDTVESLLGSLVSVFLDSRLELEETFISSNEKPPDSRSSTDDEVLNDKLSMDLGRE